MAAGLLAKEARRDDGGTDKGRGGPAGAGEDDEVGRVLTVLRGMTAQMKMQRRSR